MWAQTWTASEVGAGDFYLYNVGAAGYLIGSNNWDTQASVGPGGILTTLAAVDGGYTISTNSVYSNNYLGANGYVDNGTAAAWVFTAVEGETNTYILKQGDNYLYWGGSGTALTLNGTAPTNSNGYWKLVTRDNRNAALSNATEDVPADATFLLSDPRFSRNYNHSAWQGDKTFNDQTKNANICVERFNTNFDVYQTISGVPNG